MPRNDPEFSHRRGASLRQRTTRAQGAHRGRQSRVQPHAALTIPRTGATKQSVRIHPGASRLRPRHRRHQPKSKIPTAPVARGFPPSGTFVRLPAPETLHDGRPSVARTPTKNGHRVLAARPMPIVASSAQKSRKPSRKERQGCDHNNQYENSATVLRRSPGIAIRVSHRTRLQKCAFAEVWDVDPNRTARSAIFLGSVAPIGVCIIRPSRCEASEAPLRISVGSKALMSGSTHYARQCLSTTV
jgi:hypothetical protein